MATRGNQPGSKRQNPRAGSLQARLALIPPGGVEWLESTPEGYGSIMRCATLPDARRTEAMQGRQFTCSVWRALQVQGGVDSPAVVLVRVQRIA